MTKERFCQLMDDQDEELTQSEIDAGWHFCTEMDGLLANSNDPDGDCFCELNTRTMSTPIEIKPLADQPAFPSHIQPNYRPGESVTGITVRTYIATAMLQGYMAANGAAPSPDHAAKISVAFTDALIAQLEKP